MSHLCVLQNFSFPFFFHRVLGGGLGFGFLGKSKQHFLLKKTYNITLLDFQGGLQPIRTTLYCCLHLHRSPCCLSQILNFESERDSPEIRPIFTRLVTLPCSFLWVWGPSPSLALAQHRNLSTTHFWSMMISDIPRCPFTVFLEVYC